jgi:hypothetical protein
MATFVLNYAINLGKKLIGLILLYSWKTILCSENKVIQQLTVT